MMKGHRRGDRRLPYAAFTQGQCQRRRQRGPTARYEVHLGSLRSFRYDEARELLPIKNVSAEGSQCTGSEDRAAGILSHEDFGLRKMLAQKCECSPRVPCTLLAARTICRGLYRAIQHDFVNLIRRSGA